MSLWSLNNSQSLQEVFEEADDMPHISIPIDDIIIIPKFPTFKPANENSGYAVVDNLHMLYYTILLDDYGWWILCTG